MAKRIKKRTPVKAEPLLDARKREEMLGILLILFGLLLAIGLLTYQNENPQDVNPSLVRNQLGIAGVYLSWALIHGTIGYPVVVLPFIFIAMGIFKLLGRQTLPLRHWAWFTFLLALYISMGFATWHYIQGAPSAQLYEYSGFIGVLLATLLRKLIGVTGAVIVLIGLTVINIVIFTSFSLRELYANLSAGFSRLGVRISQNIRSIRGVKSKPEVAVKRFRAAEPQGPVVTRPLPIDLADEEEERPPVRVAMPQPPVAVKLHEQPWQEEENGTENEEDELASAIKPGGPYTFPPLSLLQPPEETAEPISEEELREKARLLEAKLADFDIQARVTEIHPGPVITRYEMELAPGIKVSRITGLADDLAMAMRAKRIRIVAPIPGKNAIGVEIPNDEPQMVYLREILASTEFQSARSPLSIGLGKTISGAPYVTDLASMPHLLVAGSTGSGKSVCLNTIITSFLYKAHPAQVQLVLIDPKRLELSTYSRLHPYHLSYVEGVREKVATTAKSAIAVLRSAEQEMERRYDMLAIAGVRNIEEYNQRAGEGRLHTESGAVAPPLHYLVIVVDELADLMLTSSASKDVEEPIARLTQMSRAVGIHLIVATQRPSVDVITGVIKANFPARMAFQVATKVDSRTILDMNGAEKLLGKGDMLFLPPGSAEPIRIHNAFISLEEIERVLSHIHTQPPVVKTPLPAYIDEETAGSESERGAGNGRRDPFFNEAMRIVVRTGQGSVSILQRRLKVGYSRAARLIDELEMAGVVGPFEGSKAREVLMRPEDLENLSGDSVNDGDEVF
ncbi:MAG TPA: DNA translocase FtsK 4TM domain-containing protein [bacterium]|nr:DNA translocase FtsK 4TM domain-containing protein [bacterium]HQG44590.1 DNA translocase FtsK 4TM domain-containing protein [bacterium]HQI47809.1 DNA translocase FtsK 4TM domain-containing protein [bacterium]HQJ65432.1 DNA translocase FtsK 4TM domain-containing protein [bacterium]